MSDPTTTYPEPSVQECLWRTVLDPDIAAALEIGDDDE